MNAIKFLSSLLYNIRYFLIRTQNSCWILHNKLLYFKLRKPIQLKRKHIIIVIKCVDRKMRSTSTWCQGKKSHNIYLFLRISSLLRIKNQSFKSCFMTFELNKHKFPLLCNFVEFIFNHNQRLQISRTGIFVL